MAGTTFLPSLGGLRQASATAALAGGDTRRRNMAAKSVIPASSVSLHRSAGSSGCQKRIRSTILQTWAVDGCWVQQITQIKRGSQDLETLFNTLIISGTFMSRACLKPSHKSYSYMKPIAPTPSTWISQGHGGHGFFSFIKAPYLVAVVHDLVLVAIIKENASSFLATATDGNRINERQRMESFRGEIDALQWEWEDVPGYVQLPQLESLPQILAY